jgi:hypothetical protein
MTMPKRGSRLIEVDGARYRWAVSHRIDPRCAADLRSGHQYLTVLVEREGAPGALAQASVRLADRGAVVGPAVVAELIRHAVENGWRPLERPGVRVVGLDRMCDEFLPCDVGPGRAVDRSRWPRNS